MNHRVKSNRAIPIRWVICAAMLHCGCWWQRDAYTERMRGQVARLEKEAEYDRVLGAAFEGPGEFPMWIRPPKATTVRKLPAEQEAVLIGLFQSEPGAGLIEFVIIGSTGNEPLAEFEQKAFADLNKTGKGPGIELKRQEAATVQCMHGGETTFDLFSGAAKRQLSPTGAPTSCQWVCYFAEDQTQKIMLAFVIPDTNYEAFTDAMSRCLETLALSGKVSAAKSGVPTGAPAAAPAGGSTNF